MNQHEHRLRFKDAQWSNPNFKVTVGGAGSIGSWLLLFLSRIGYPIYLYEMDTVEVSNMGGQLYGKNDIGSTKQESIRNHLYNFAMYDEIESMGKYESESFVTPIVFTCFDNMKSRKEMFEKWKKTIKEDELCLFVDGRLTAESFQMYIVTPERIKGYEKTLFEDKEIPDLPCSYKSTSHIAAMLASQMTTAMTNAVTNFLFGNIRDIPFETKYEASLFMYEQEFEPKIEAYAYS